jgi:hypothetical protein
MLAGDCFPILYKYARSLDKGDYVVRLHVRHERIELLEKLKDVSLHVRHTPSGSSLLVQDVYTSMSTILKGGASKKPTERIQKNTERSFFLAPIADDKLPKGIANGNFLIGELTLFKDAAICQVDTHRILYQINNYGGSKKNNDKQSEKAAAKPLDNSLNTAVSSTVTNVSEKDAEQNGSFVATSSVVAAKNSNKADEKLLESIRDIKVAHILK